MKKSDRKYYVYRHTSPSGKVYIGITSHRVTKRWGRGTGYKNSPIFKHAINKYGWENIKHEIILKDVTKSEASYAEKYLIRWYKIHHISYNVADGGEINTGLIPWNKGKSWSEKVRKKLSVSHSGSNSYWWRRPVSEEHRRHISEAKKGIATKVSKVQQFTLSGKFVKEWNSISDAARALGIDASAISKCCRGKRNKVFNYKWRYKNENKNTGSARVA